MRLLTSDMRALLRSPAIRMRLLMTFFLDEGTYRFCDDIVDVTDGTNLWIGAGALGGQIEMRSGRDLSAEPITLTLDGNHLTQAGVQDPAKVLRDMMNYLYMQRRVDLAFGFSYLDTTDMFFSFTADAANTERVLFWGKKSLAGSSFGGTGGGGGTTSPYRGTAGGGGGGGGGGGSLRGGSRN
jgi:uncharacterized membrane protein YgcG